MRCKWIAHSMITHFHLCVKTVCSNFQIVRWDPTSVIFCQFVIKNQYPATANREENDPIISDNGINTFKYLCIVNGKSKNLIEVISYK